MATTQATGIESVGTIDGQTATTPQTFLADLITDDLRLTDWGVFRSVAECSVKTIDEVRP